MASGTSGVSNRGPSLVRALIFHSLPSRVMIRPVLLPLFQFLFETSETSVVCSSAKFTHMPIEKLDDSPNLKSSGN